MLLIVFFTQLIIITPAWPFPDGEFDGGASDPYINIKCHFNSSGPKPTVVIEANCDGSMDWHKTLEPLKLERSADDTFVVANVHAASVYGEFLEYLNFRCYGKRFKKDDFATYKVISDVNQLKIYEEGRWVDIFKAR
ncbi:hypothetical protein FOL47_001535 [Perkinsus chesapeaki]|uniref:Uncharacterized protein n=1 Tax=Perkinsus chesapeaki TaxID=330153 RepID=A0A7J6KSG6_PERCH|nr:hypothetical protein FOL47_001535 [Perkinsus chesapeaki]